MRAPVKLSRRLFVFALLASGLPSVADDEPIHCLIDAKLRSAPGVESPQSSDAEFLRRICLDLIGMPPTADEAREFIADPAADKRRRVIDQLFASPHYARRLASALDLMLMERRPNANVGADEWQAWLLKSVKDNKPWNELVREILLADGDDPVQRPAARFVLDRASDPNVLTRDIGRIFFGRDMQCAQCHDHPLVGEYLQSDYHGLLAFVAPGYPLVRTDAGKQVTVQAEKAGTDLTFESVFVGKPRRTGPRIPDDVVIDEPFFLPGEEYEVAPAENVKSTPKFSRRAKLAELATSGSNHAFNRNIANRLWAHMFGRGLVHPLDLHHPDNPAIEPDLLRILGERFAAMNFDMRQFLREIALSNAYQRSLDPPADVHSLANRAKQDAEQLRQLRDAQKTKASASVNAYAEASQAWEDAEASLLPVAGEFDAARNEYAVAKTNLDAAVKAKTEASTQLSTKQSVAPPVQQAAAAAQAAAKALPEDKELAEAAQKFVVRSEQLVAEITALTKTVDEKTAALPTLNEAFAAARPKVDDGRAKTTPLTTVWREREHAMLAARLQAAAEAESLAALNRQLATARKLAKLPELKQAIAAAEHAVPTRELELADARRRLEEGSAVVSQKEAEVAAATASLAAAAAKLESARVAHINLVAATESIVATAANAQAANGVSPSDAGLADAAARFQNQANLHRAEAMESQRRFDAESVAHDGVKAALEAARQSLAVAITERDQRAAAADMAAKLLAAAQAEVAARQGALASAEAELIDRWTQDFTIASLKVLTPEQLCWSVFRATGVYDNYWRTEMAELDKTHPLDDQQKADRAQLVARDFDVEQRTYDKLKPNIGTFVTFYGAAAGQPQGDFFSTADQALFAANGGSINAWVAPAGDNVTERIVKQTDVRAAAQELYLAVLTRPPTENETSEVMTYLAHRAPDRAAAAQELVWALLNSAEFRFNH